MRYGEYEGNEPESIEEELPQNYIEPLYDDDDEAHRYLTFTKMDITNFVAVLFIGVSLLLSILFKQENLACTIGGGLLGYLSKEVVGKKFRE